MIYYLLGVISETDGRSLVGCAFDVEVEVLDVILVILGFLMNH